MKPFIIYVILAITLGFVAYLLFGPLELGETSYAKKEKDMYAQISSNCIQEIIFKEFTQSVNSSTTINKIDLCLENIDAYQQYVSDNRLNLIRCSFLSNPSLCDNAERIENHESTIIQMENDLIKLSESFK